MSEISNMSRREFLRTTALLGGGLILGFSLPGGRFSEATAKAPGDLFALNAFLRIGTDDTVTVIVNKSEMGQGVYTSLPMLIAEELEADWPKIHVEAAPVDPAYNHTQWGSVQGTGGSTSVASEWVRFRKAGAAAREMLVTAAAQTWKVDKASCRAVSGKVIHTSGKSMTYGQLAERAAALPVPKKIRLKNPSEYKFIGKPAKRLDTPEKVDGKAVFGIDVTVPGMLTSVIARPPLFGATVKTLNAEKAKAVPGVTDVVRIDAGVAVVAKDFWSATRGGEALDIVWDEGPLAGFSTDKQRQMYADMAKKPGAVAARRGNPAAAFAQAAKKIEAEYEVPYLAHATMEPLNCVVDLRADGCEIWTGTQFQTVDRDSAAKVLGLEKEHVKIHTTFLGGGFGRRANPYSDFVTQAAQVAKAVKKPVKVTWTREDDMRGGYYRPMWYDRIRAGLDGKGTLIAWQHTIVGQSIIAGTVFEAMLAKGGIDETSVEGAADTPYEIPNFLVDLHSPKLAIPVLWWRSVGHSHTAFVVETFMDELARAAGKDAYDFRLRLLRKHPRHLGVLKLAAEKSGWGKPLPNGVGRGIAVHKSFGTFIAQVAEVSVTPEGGVRVNRVVCAVDCGRVVNPDAVAAQMESAVAFGLSAALHGAITFKDGRVEQSNFHDYPVLRMNEMPSVETYLVPRAKAPSGIGEPGVPPIAPAVVNAIYAVTGKVIRRLPIRPEELKKA